MATLRAESLVAINLRRDLEPLEALQVQLNLTQTDALTLMGQLVREQHIHLTTSGWHLTASGHWECIKGVPCQ